MTTEGEVSKRASRRGLFAAGLLGYLVGGFPTADLVSKVAARRTGKRSIDLREVGMKNPGAWNAGKVLGVSWGVTVLVGDLLKGAAACVLGRSVAGDNGAYMAGTTSVMGHCFPLWKGFRGGKGLATSAGTALACFPPYAPIDASLAGAALLLLRGRGDAATYVASAAFTLVATYWWLTRKGNLWGPKPTAGLPLYALTSSAVIALSFLRSPLAKSPLAIEEEAGAERAVEQNEEASVVA